MGHQPIVDKQAREALAPARVAALGSGATQQLLRSPSNYVNTLT